jgi:outer membrane protein assembly factor BamB
MRFGPLLGVCVSLSAAVRAEPVPIGRYAEIHVGISHKHPYAASGADARRSGRSRSRVSSTAPSRLWSVVLPHARLVPPAVLADGTLIVGSAAGIYSLDPVSGAARWFAPVGDVRFTPSLTPEGELVAIASGKLVVLTQAGAARELSLPSSLTSAPLVLDSGSVVAAGRDGQIYAVTTEGASLLSVPISIPVKEGEPRWTASAGGDLVVAAGRGPELFLFWIQSDNARSIRLSESIATHPIASDDEMLWVLGQRGTLFGIGADAQTRWSAVLGQGGPADGPALGWDGALRVGLRYGEIACVAPNGQERWRRGIDSAPGPMLIDADDTLLFVSARGTLYAIDHKGDLRWRVGLDLRGAGRPVLGADGTLYLVSRGGQLQAFR